MTTSGLLVFAAVYTLAVASPGPGVAAVVARGLGRGADGLAPFILGFVVADLIWFSAAAAGLTLLAQTFSGFFLVLRYAGAAYLVWLGWKFWTAPAQPAQQASASGAGESGWRAFLGSLSLTLGNPKAMVFFIALLPSLIDLDHLTLLAFAEVAGVIAVGIASVMAGYSLLAVRARRLFTSASAIRALNRGSGAVMLGAAVAVASR